MVSSVFCHTLLPKEIRPYGEQFACVCNLPSLPLTGVDIPAGMDWDRTFVTQLFACCERATSLTTSLHLSILRPTEVLSAACGLMLVHLCYATARLLFELGFSGRSFQIPQYCCHSWVQNVPLYSNTTPAGPSLQLLYCLPPPTSQSSGSAILPFRGANTVILLPAGCQGQGVPRGPGTLLTSLFGSLRSAVDTGTKRSFYSNKGFHCHCSLCVSLSYHWEEIIAHRMFKTTRAITSFKFTSIFISPFCRSKFPQILPFFTLYLVFLAEALAKLMNPT